MKFICDLNQQEIFTTNNGKLWCYNNWKASTENPFFTLTSAICSRLFLYEFKAFTKEEMNKILWYCIKDIEINIQKDALEYLIISSSGDARAMLTLLNFAYKVSKEIDITLLKELRENVMEMGFIIWYTLWFSKCYDKVFTRFRY